ncbi:uncharacterized protein LOC127436650 [Myxocyprinus asiaticus]|uniref:uncharacterized protein LOC127436650 n=1 Tax=Myxocyprinus asiaticus TaxID=70543 RepID=UPI002221BC0E|nr:uncharacterized protein LOC127436650 [Myxocyprinus asiaticus]XP_051546887.1 uncharacterized protein LOC127436650 [Myxocyprinus asiaticus]XP_051546888.1 uncharacterized protein LOC127436650 [Myxocyprinus asiaticus]
MQGFNWTSNQRPPPKYQEQPPPKYQEQPPPKYQERLPPMCQPTRNDQIQFNPQLYNSVQQRFSNAQQQYWNYPQGFRSSSEKPLALSFQPNAKLSHPNLLGSQTQQHCTQGMVSQPEVPSENPKTNRLYAQYNTQYVSFSQNYRNTGPVQNNHDPNQAPVYWSSRSDHGGSRAECNGNTRGWKLHISDNGSSRHMNNQQQPPSSRTAPLHHQQWFSGKQAGKLLTMHHSTPVLSQQSTSWAQNNVMTQRMHTSQAQSTATVHHTSSSSPTLPSSGAQKSISTPSNNFQQSPVNQSQLELRMNAGPNVSATQSQNIDNRTCGINQTTKNQTQQRTPTNEAHLNPQSKPDLNLIPYVNPLLYKLLYSDDNEQGFANSSVTNKQPSDGRTGNQNAFDRTDYNLHSQRHFSLQRTQCTDEPPSKRMNCGVSQKDYWNQVPSKELSISKDASGFASQFAFPGIYLTGRTEQNSSEKRHNTRQHKVQYTTDPADCLEAVFALQKAAQQVHKAIAIVPPISQQTSNTAQMDDTSPKTVDSPPLKIDAVWSIAEEPILSPVTKINDKLYQLPAPVAQQDDRSLSIKNETTNITDTCIPQSSDICSANSTGECQNYLQQNDIQQSDCDSGDTVFNLSNVPVNEYTLLKLMNLAKSIQMEEITKLSTRITEIPESVFSWIMELYWKGNTYNFVKSLKSYRKLIECSLAGGVKNYESVVFESISSDNLKKLAHCDILENGIYLSSEEFRSSWLNVDGWPADIDKVLSEPLSDYIPSDNVGVNSLKEAPEVTSLSTEQSVKPNTCSSWTESHSEVFTPLAGNGKQETVIKYKGHADLSPLSEMPSEDLIDNSKDSSKDTEVLRKEHVRVTQDISLSSSQEVVCLESAVSDSLPVNPVDEILECASAVSDDVKTSKMSFSTEVLSNSTNTCQVEDISDDENSGNKEVASNSTNTWQVEDISDDENSGKKEAASKSTVMWQVEDISDDDSSGYGEALKKSTDVLLVEDNSDNENSDEPDIYVVEAVSNNENSSDDSMTVTVLSSEDAINLFQQLQKEPQCNVKTKSTQSNVDTPKLVAWFSSPSQPNYECSEAKICSCCGTNRIEKSNSPHVTKKYNDVELFCSHCWDEAPLLELEEELFSPMRNKTFGSPTKSDEWEQSSSPPTLELEIQVSNVPLTEECIEDKGLIGKKSDNMVKSAMPDLKIQSSVEEELPKIQPDKVKSDKISLTKLQMPIQCNTPPPTKSVFVKHKPKSDSTRTGVDDCALFAPDIVMKSLGECNLCGVSEINHSCGENQNCRNLKKDKEPRQDPKTRNDSLQAVMDRISQNCTESLHKVRENVSSHSNATQCMTTMPHKSNNKLDMHNGAQLFKKMRKNEKKKVKFALYGSKDEDQCVALERRPPAPLTLTVSTAGKDYAGVLSAKQKVHNQWSSTYIHKVKKNSKPKSPQVKKRMTSPPKSPQKKMNMTSSPPKAPWQKKKMQKPQEGLKLNMDTLKSHLKQRALQLSSKEIELNYSRKPFSQQKLTNTLHDTTLHNSLQIA